jgi:shikimate dehydrogenase
VALPVPPELLEIVVRGLGAVGYRGVNVTTPHKQAILPLLDSVALSARELGAVNTLIFGQREQGSATGTDPSQAGGVHRVQSCVAGCNTDDRGFIGALRHAGFEPEERRGAVIVGSGGAARAVAYGLLWSGVRDVVLLNRSRERAQALVADLGSLHTWPGKLGSLPLTPELLLESTRAADLLVNATTVGMWPHIDGSIWPEGLPIPAHLTVFDLVYNPLKTRLLRQALESGAQPIGGLEMLVRQGALAFEMWTGEPPPLGVMRAAAREALHS